MSFLINTFHRSSATEMMDDFTLKGVDFRDTLDKLEIIKITLKHNFERKDKSLFLKNKLIA